MFKDEQVLEAASTCLRQIEHDTTSIPASGKQRMIIGNSVQVGFIYGAHWAIEEFLKDLWHDASEEPRAMERIITHSKDDDTYKVISWTTMWHTWDVYTEIDHIDKWLYLDDLLPKEGGEHEEV